MRRGKILLQKGLIKRRCWESSCADGQEFQLQTQAAKGPCACAASERELVGVCLQSRDTRRVSPDPEVLIRS